MLAAESLTDSLDLGAAGAAFPTTLATLLADLATQHGVPATSTCLKHVPRDQLLEAVELALRSSCAPKVAYALLEHVH